MDTLKYIAAMSLFLLLYSLLNTPYSYYSWALGEHSSFANNLWLFVALIKLGLTYLFLHKLGIENTAILTVLLTASFARIAFTLPFPIIILGYVMYFTKWLTLPYAKIINTTNN